MEASQDLVSRLKNKYPMLRYFTDRTFGVEIEFYGLDYFILPPDGGVIKPYNVHSKSWKGAGFLELLQEHGLELGADKDHWHLEEDSSITHRGGVELISPVLRGFKGLIETYRFFQLLGDIKGVQIDDSCGFHVHHGVNSETYKCLNLKELVRIVYAMEDHIYRLIEGDRAARTTCRPMELDTELFLKAELCPDGCNDHCPIREIWYSLGNRYDPDSRRPDRYDMTRYHGLNLHSYWFRSTIEFRYHCAVLQEIDEAMQWIVFSQFLVEISDGHVPPVYYSRDANRWMKAIYKIYLAFNHLDQIEGLRNTSPTLSSA